MARRDVEHTELPYPNGWFAVAYSRDLIEGGVQAIHYFGEDMVLFRTRSGQARVLDAFCPHLGAHIGEGGRVMGETVRCPFHGWQYDGESGNCTHIPYCERIPSQAQVRPWHTQEKNGMIFVWYHAEGKAPDWDFPLIEEIGHADWSEPRAVSRELPAHVQDTHENNSDSVHFQFVHGMTDTPPSETLHDTDGTLRVVSHCEEQLPGGETAPYDMVRDSWGLGLMSLRMEGFAGVGLLMFSSTTPIEKERVITRWLLTVTKNMADVAGEDFMKNMVDGVNDDMRVWEHKVHRARPVLCEADDHLSEYRKWARRFYSEPVGDEAS